MCNYDKNNIFAKILRGEIPCDKVFENEYVLAFHDIAPKAPIHIVIIPKKPYCSFIDFYTDASSDMIYAFHKAIAQITKKLNIEKTGSRLITNQGKDAGQEIPHLHFHLLAGKSLPCF
jgi:histidine triad (HIT) family protein